MELDQGRQDLVVWGWLLNSEGEAKPMAPGGENPTTRGKSNSRSKISPSVEP